MTDKPNNPLCLPLKFRNPSNHRDFVFVEDTQPCLGCGYIMISGDRSHDALEAVKQIIRAVNSHAALVAALESCRESLSKANKFLGPFGKATAKRAIDQADAALKEARG